MSWTLDMSPALRYSHHRWLRRRYIRVFDTFKGMDCGIQIRFRRSVECMGSGARSCRIGTPRVGQGVAESQGTHRLNAVWWKNVQRSHARVRVALRKRQRAPFCGIGRDGSCLHDVSGDCSDTRRSIASLGLLPRQRAAAKASQWRHGQPVLSSCWAKDAFVGCVALTAMAQYWLPWRFGHHLTQARCVIPKECDFRSMSFWYASAGTWRIHCVTGIWKR